MGRMGMCKGEGMFAGGRHTIYNVLEMSLWQVLLAIQRPISV